MQGQALIFTLFLPLNSAEFWSAAATRVPHTHHPQQRVFALGAAAGRHPADWAGDAVLGGGVCGGVGVAAAVQDGARVAHAGRPVNQGGVRSDVESVDSSKCATLQLNPTLKLCTGIKELISVYLINRIGFIAYDSLTILKLADRGFKCAALDVSVTADGCRCRKEQLAFTSFIDFPAQMLLGVLVVRYAKSVSAVCGDCISHCITRAVGVWPATATCHVHARHGARGNL